MLEKKKVNFGEEWKYVQLEDIKQEHKYQISNYGRLRRWKEELNDWFCISLNVKNPNYLMYYPFPVSSGKRRGKSKSIHRCVAECFCVRASLEHKNVIHLDYNKQNNKASNLKWVTNEELYAHNNKNPKVIQKRVGMSRNPTNSKLNATQVIRIKKKLARGKMPYYKIAKEFGISHTQLKRIRRGENWGDITID